MRLSSGFLVSPLMMSFSVSLTVWKLVFVSYRPHVDVKKLGRNTKVVAEALARVIYNLTEKGAPGDLQIFTEQMVQEEQLSAVVDWLTAQPRAAQLVDKDSSVVSTLEYHLGRYLKDVKRHYVKADKRDPEFVFYDQLKQTMNAY
ncbi:nicalin-1-like, partial [Seriola lalandi dorsalis]|uniref:nicalin-1-like n=1 Tax=Seriola lalandi dorsalis TaxID=1841481 RepID=UPI000C6F8E4E